MGTPYNVTNTNTRNPPRLFLCSRKLRRKTLLYRKLITAYSTTPSVPLRSTYNSEALSLPAVAENTLNPFYKTHFPRSPQYLRVYVHRKSQDLRPLRRSRRGHRRNQADAELHPYTHSAA